MDGGPHDLEENGPPPAALGLTPGCVLNGIYRVHHFVTRGGMGDVYAGINIETEDKVAIKAMLPRLAADPKILSLFRSEARLLTRVSHPAVAQYRVFARDPLLGVHYLVTDFIDGETLSTRLCGEAPDVSAAIRLLRRLADGLRVTHEIGAVHRDMSPDNILLPGGRIEAAKIIDFGIAKYVEPDDRTIVIEGFAGKLGYVAPEQFGLFGNRIGPWTDVYSTALVTLAFARADTLDMGRTIAEAVEKRGGVPDLEGLPGQLRPLIGAMLTPDPAKRIASMDAVAVALDALERTAAPRLADPKSVKLRPTVPSAARARPAPSRFRPAGRVLLALIAAATLLVAGLLILLWSRSEQPARRPRLTPIAARAPSFVPVSTVSPSPASTPSRPPDAAVSVLPTAPPDAPSAAAAPLTLVASTSSRGLRPNTHGCGPGGGVWTVAMVGGLANASGATLLFLTPSGAAQPVFSGAAQLRALATRHHALMRNAGDGRYRISLCAHESGQAGYALFGGTRAVPMLTGSSAIDTANRYRDLAAREGWPLRLAWLSIAPMSATAAAPSSEPPTLADSTPSQPAPTTIAPRVLPPFAFCRRYVGGSWHDLGVQKQDACFAAAFDHGGAMHAQFGSVLLRHYNGFVEVQIGGAWQQVTPLKAR